MFNISCLTLSIFEFEDTFSINGIDNKCFDKTSMRFSKF